MIKGSVFGLVSAVVAVCIILIIVSNKSATSKVNARVHLLKTSIQKENLTGKKPDAVLAFLTRENIDHSEYVVDKSYTEYSNVIYASDRISAHTFGAGGPVTWQVLMEFKFDKNDRLKHSTVSSVATGL